MNFKSKLFLFAMLLMAMAVKAQQPLALTVENFEIKPGETKKAYIAMQNEGYEIIAIEFKLELPAGLSLKGRPTLVKDRIGSGEDDFGDVVESAKTVNGSKNAAGYWTFSIFSMTDQFPFAGTEGNVIEMNIAADADMSIGDTSMRLYDIELSTKETPYYPEEYSNTVTVYKTHNITVSVADEKMGTAIGGGEFRLGQEATVTATANEGYHFVNWTSEGVVVSTYAAYTFTVSADVSLTANFVPNEYKVIIAETENGTVEASTLTPWYGEDVVLTITPADNYLLKSLTVNGDDVTADVVEGQYTIQAVKADVTVEAVFIYDEATGINAARWASHADKPVHDLNGRKVADEFNQNPLPQGVYIVDGKKVMVK